MDPDPYMAVKDALRHAIEQGGSQEIASKSKTKDYALEYDVILSRASGLVKHNALRVAILDSPTIPPEKMPGFAAVGTVSPRNFSASHAQ